MVAKVSYLLVKAWHFSNLEGFFLHIQHVLKLLGSLITPDEAISIDINGEAAHFMCNEAVILFFLW